MFDAALEHDVEDREQWVRDRCGEDPALVAEVRTLLRAHRDAGGFLEDPAWSGVAPRLDDESTLEPGARLGPWRVVGIVGRGGMGVVYRAVRDDGAFDREVAIKLMRGLSGSPALHARFDAERRILAGLDHPGIARLLDAGTSADGVPYLVLDLVDGEPIDVWCASRALSLRDRLGLFVDVCDAVAYAHERLVLHRDLKPSNVLVTAAGRPKLLDFGIAKLLDPETGGEREATRTAFGPRPLTPEYASPEQLAGEPLDTSSDVWSLAVVLFRLLTGAMPYAGAVLALAGDAAHRDQVSPPSASGAVGGGDWPIRARELRGDLDVILEKALEPDRTRRYRTVGELGADLRRHLEGRPVAARRPSTVYRAVRFARRNQVAVGAAAVSVAGLIAAAVVSLRQASVARRERDRATRRLAEVRQLANVFLFDVHDALGNIAGTTTARELLVETGLTYLDRLAAEAADDPTLAREIASGYERLGRLQGGTQVAHLGRTGAALASFERASALRRALIEGGVPAGDDLLSETARGELGMSEALTTVGRVKDALQHSARAIELLERVAARRPDDVTAAIELGAGLATHGYQVAFAGDLDGALPFLRRSLVVLEPLLDATEPDARAERAYVLAIHRLAMILGEIPAGTGRAEAIELLPRAIEIDRRSLETDASRADRRRDLSRDAGLLARLLADEGHHAEALLRYQEIARLLEEEVRLDPADRMARRNLGALRARQARSLLAAGREEEARLLLEPALQALEEDLAADPTNAFLLFTVAEVATRLGEALVARAIDASADQRGPGCSAARPPLERAIGILQPLTEDGTLTGSDAAVLDQAFAALAKCISLV